MKTPLQLLREELKKIIAGRGSYTAGISGKEWDKRWNADTRMIRKYKLAIKKLLNK